MAALVVVMTHRGRSALNKQNLGNPNTPLNFVRIKMLAQNPAPVCVPSFGRYASI